jgi:predicted Fe-Mo cluster-binding NifX family protein
MPTGQDNPGDAVRLLIPTTDTNGANAQLSGHFGRAPYYSLADTETGTVTAVANASVSRDHGECVPASEVFGRDGFDAVVCQGIGAGAINRLAQAGVTVFVHEGPDVASAMAAFRSRSLRMVGTAGSCSGSGSCGEKGHGR